MISIALFIVTFVTAATAYIQEAKMAEESFGCDLIIAGIKLDAASRNDTCFLSDSNCEKCTIDKDGMYDRL